MFGIEIMSGAILLSAIKYGSTAIVFWVAYRLWSKTRRLVDYEPEEFLNSKNKPKLWLSKVWKELAMGFIVISFLGVFESVAVPKITIDAPPSTVLKSYQDNTSDVEIITPALRTEKLNGFEPLKKD